MNPIPARPRTKSDTVAGSAADVRGGPALRPGSRLYTVLVDKCNRHAALLNRRCNSFDRASPDVAPRDHSNRLLNAALSMTTTVVR
jgi:hypothetical protein